MHVGRISLCDGTAHNIKSDDDKARILDELERQYGVKVVQRHHEDFRPDRHVDLLNRVPHLACTRSNGNPYFVYLTRCGFVNQCILVDKKVQQGYFFPRMILLRLRFRDDLYDNTLFDGEMVRSRDDEEKNKKKKLWFLLLGDVLVHRKRPLTHVNLVDRINLLHAILAEDFVADDQDVCLLRVKTYFTCDRLRHLVEEFVPRLPYTCRGVYFRPFSLRQRAVLVNFDDSLIRRDVRVNYRSSASFMLSAGKDDVATMPRPQAPLAAPLPPPPPPPPLVPRAPAQALSQAPEKKEEKETKTMWVKHTRMPDVYELYPANGGRPFVNPRQHKVDIASVPNLACSLMLRRTFEYYGVNDAVLMHCVYDERFKKWAPTCVATEKV